MSESFFKVLLDEQKIIKPFFRYAVNHKLEEMISKAHGAVGLQHITKPKLEKILIPIPSLPEQRCIVAYLDKLQERVDALKKLQEETEKELDALLPSVLNQAFNGGIEN